MEMLWFGNWGRPVIVFPTSGGRYWESEDFHLVDSLAERIDRGEIQVVSVDAINHVSWLDDGLHPGEKIRRHALYDRYLREEVVPYVFHRAQRSDLAVYGASLGAYHAANFAGRHPDVVSLAVCFSGVYDIQRFLHGFWNDECYFHCPTAYLPNLHGEALERARRVQWVIATGEHDSVVHENRSFADILRDKGIPVRTEFWEGQFGHDWPWWREHLRRFV